MNVIYSLYKNWLDIFDFVREIELLIGAEFGAGNF